MERQLNCTDAKSAELEMTVNMLIQIDKLVQLLESPVFTCRPLSHNSGMFAEISQTYDSSFSSPKNILISISAFTAFSCCFLNPLHLQH
jgi:hypothetical protein